MILNTKADTITLSFTEPKIDLLSKTENFNCIVLIKKGNNKKNVYDKISKLNYT